MLFSVLLKIPQKILQFCMLRGILRNPGKSGFQFLADSGEDIGNR
jgi:hypothetical protein